MSAEKTGSKAETNDEMTQLLNDIERLLRGLEEARSNGFGESLAARLETIEEKLGNLEALVGTLAPSGLPARVDDLVEKIIASRIKSDLESSLEALGMVRSYLHDRAPAVAHAERTIPDGALRAGGDSAATADAAVLPSAAAITADAERDPILSRIGSTYRETIVKLPRRKREILQHLLMGKSNREIGLALGITEKTVKNSLYQIYQILDVKSRAQLIHRLLDPLADRETAPTRS